MTDDTRAQALSELVGLLELERLEANLFRGQSQDLGWGNVFGGQALGQALSAAEQTVPADRECHSFHGYFLRVGNAKLPIIYDVDPIRDGKSFTTRRVKAIQSGRPIFSMSASFHVREEGYDHQASAPDAPPPEEVAADQDWMNAHRERMPAPLRDRITASFPIESRSVDVFDPFRPVAMPPRRRIWVRAAGRLAARPALHRYLLAYASDLNLLGAALQPHGVSWFTPGMQVASLDHTMYFHRAFRFDDWLLYVIESPSATGARGLAHGRYFDRAGRLVASTVQEGLIRDHEWPRSDS
ncbi:MAG: acyl-CoA thioesterase II [Myxococcota bacterium]